MMKRRNDFTLIELVVAMGVMMSVAALLAFSSKIFYDGYRRSLRITNALKERMAVDRVMDTLVRNMIPFHWYDTQQESSRLVFDGAADSMLFVAPRRAGKDASGALFFIRLALEENKLVASYASCPRLPWDEENELVTWEKEVIAENVSAVQFQYAETGSGEDPLEWCDTWEEEEHAALPLAVQMKVEWLDGSSEVWLRRAAGISAHSTFGVRETVSTGESQ